MTEDIVFLEHKWTRAFEVLFDTDKNKELEKQDFVLLVQKIKQQRGVDSRCYILAKNSMDKIWNGLLKFDTNKDQKVSIDEWIAMWKSVVIDRKQPVDKWLDVYVQYLFALFDMSGDGKIDRNEYIQAMALYGCDRNDASVAFDKFAQGAIAITTTAFDKLWQEFFYSKNRNAPGNWLFAGKQH